jgi:hypothetical protein
MLVVLTTVFRVKNWQAFRYLSDQTLLSHARAAGATRYRIYRNANDAAEALLIAEVSSYDAIAQIRSALIQIHNDAIAQPGAASDGFWQENRVWESTACAAIDSLPG